MKRWDVLSQYIAANGWTYGVELGVYTGATLFSLLDRHPNLHMLGVDTWQPLSDKAQNRITGDVCYDALPMQSIRDAVLKRARAYGDRCTILVADTAQSAARVPVRSVDFVFVDADHHTDAVRCDVLAWMPRIRAGGAMFGHDANWPSVQRALKSTFGEWTSLDANMWKVGATA